MIDITLFALMGVITVFVGGYLFLKPTKKDQ